MHQKGDIDEAKHIYLKIIEINSNHFDALHLLGLIEYQKNNLDKAFELISKAIIVNSKNAFAHSNIGVVLIALKRPEEAIKNYNKAIILKPDYEEAYNNRGNLLLELNRFEEALEDYNKAIALTPQYSLAHTNRGNALFKLGRYEESLESYNKAIERNPRCVNSYSNRGNTLLRLNNYQAALESYDIAISFDPEHAEAYSNRGVALKELKLFEKALESYDKAISLKPKYPDPYINRGNILADLGKWELAFDNYQNLLEFDRSYKSRIGFVNCIKNITAIKVTSKVEALIEQAISEAWTRPSDLIPIARSLLLYKLGLKSPEELPSAKKKTTLSNEKFHSSSVVFNLLNNSLFQCILKNDSINNSKFELFLTDVRRSLLNDLVENIEFLEHKKSESEAVEEGDRLLNFLCALASQCFINEYVYANTDKELDQIKILEDKLLYKNINNFPIPFEWLALIACYRPLSELKNNEVLLNQEFPDCLKQIITKQISEPKEEWVYRDGIPSLVKIGDEVSQLVRQQYETNPYPRWVKTINFVEGISLDEMLFKTFPKASFRKLGKENNIDVLIAGCGTGQHPIESAQVYKNARVTAIDLSLSSLCYAKRKAIEMGICNIDFAQADILELGSIDKRFDLIESVGVLHHLAEPLKGWHVLLGLLRPNGFMKIGLYSELARASVVAARKYIVERKFSTSPEDIRQCRHEILNFNENNPISRVINFTDFFGLSECRDLIFHVQEHRFTLIQLKEALKILNLNFVGFTLKPLIEKQYAERFPEDISKTNLDNWHLFEMEFPDTFRSMYQFYVQKIE